MYSLCFLAIPICSLSHITHCPKVYQQGVLHVRFIWVVMACVFDPLLPGVCCMLLVTSIANSTNRKILAKLRCSNHPLLIEVERHHKVDVDTRECNLCDRIEDEIHFVTECQLHTETRYKFFSEVGISHNDCTKTMFVNLLLKMNS